MPRPQKWEVFLSKAITGELGKPLQNAMMAIPGDFRDKFGDIIEKAVGIGGEMRGWGESPDIRAAFINVIKRAMEFGTMWREDVDKLLAQGGWPEEG